MRSLGISIARHSLSAFVWEQSPFVSKAVCSATVACAEPFGGVDDFRRLADEIRRAGGNSLPPAVVSIPPSWTFLRRIQLPVPDLPRAKKIHVGELEGNLPIDDDDILSDLLPPPREAEAGRHLAVAARRSAVEKTATAITEAGFRLDRVVTDHVAILCAALAAKTPADGLIVSGLGDVVVMRLSGGAVLWARQFPAESVTAAPEIQREIGALLDDAPGGAAPLPVAVVGDVPEPLAERLAGAARVKPPGGGALSAYGAALVPFSSAETGGFSLRTSAATDAERAREKRRVVVASAAAAVAVLSMVVAVQMVSWAEGKKVAKVRAQIRKEFSAAVPEVKNVVNERVQMKDKLQVLARQQKDLGADVPGAYEMLAKVSLALPQKENISVREAAFDSGRLRLVGDAGSSGVVETYRAALAQAFGPETGVTVQETGGAARGGSVRFTILIEKTGGRRAS